MTSEQIIKVPDLGGASQVDVIEILVKVGDTVVANTPLITLEGDKATMEIPSPGEGVVTSIAIQVGDKVSEGDAILALHPNPSDVKPIVQAEESSAPKEESKPQAPKVLPTNLMNVLVPDLGGAKEVDVIEVMVKPGDALSKETPIMVLEGEKATMEIPSPFEGIIETVSIKTGDKVSTGDLILTLRSSEAAAIETQKAPSEVIPSQERTTTISPEIKTESQVSQSVVSTSSGTAVLAGPSVRRLAREFGIELDKVKGTGRKNRIQKEDLQAFVKQKLAQPSGGLGFNLPQAPVIDFSKFGPIETKPMSKIKRLTGLNVHRSWVTIPQVTQFDEADISELEAFRKSESEQAIKDGYKLTMLAFVCKAVAKALSVFPQFNSSLDASGETLIYKKYINIGIAVETPNGLVVPVITGVDGLTVAEIAKEMGRLSVKAREKGLTTLEMTGGTFTISSLGGIGGTAFTPIVNGPEVAILGLSRSTVKPIYNGKDFEPRLMLPLSLSYDHRVIDGAEAARFTQYIAMLLSDIRKVLL